MQQTAKVSFGEDWLLLNTYCSITIYDGAEYSNEIEEALSLAREYENLLSRTVESSQISKINRGELNIEDALPPVQDLMALADEFSEKTGGRFNVHLGAVSALWNFSAEPRLPRNSEIKEALQQDVIDLGAIAKGYIADRCAEFLKEKGIKSAILDFGGNIVLVGSKADGSLWKIGIEEPSAKSGGLTGAVSVSGGSVVTSGIYERCFTAEDGKTYHHILDPDTGYPAESDVVSVTICGPLSARCDALSTSCLLLGSDEGMKLIEASEGYEAVFQLKDGSVKTSSGAAYEQL